MTAFGNRLAKNAKQRFAWAKKEGLTAFRVYDRDMPEYPVAVDWYAGHAVVHEYPRSRASRAGKAEALSQEVQAQTAQVLELPPDRIFPKRHEPKAWGTAQYGRFGRAGVTTTVEEYGAKYEVNLSDYLDTGLFMDHRNTRKRVRALVQGKTFLNLFAYTGAFTVAAALGGARATTTVDLSGSYLDWGRRNLKLNAIAPAAHTFVEADVLGWLEQPGERFDVIVCDPPSFSVSHRMGRRFEVPRDHVWLVQRLQERLTAGGALYFSTNYLEFELSPKLSPAEELTPKSIPLDFRERPHRCWRFTAAPAGPAAPRSA